MCAVSLNNSRSLRLLAPVLLYLLIASCGENVPAEYKEFLELPREKQIEMMKALPVDKQIDYYLAGRRYVHPPLSLDDVIAERGKDALPPLMNRLKKEDSEGRQLELIYVFENMHKFYYDLRNEKEAIALLQDVSAKMRDSQHKQYAERIVRDIVENRRARKYGEDQ